MKKTALSSLVFLLIAATLAESATITVHSDGTGDYPTIQAAIDAAVNGDTVLVTPGTYTGTGNRDIDFKGKAITVKSQSGPDNCIIDCNGTTTEPHRGFDFHGGEGANSVVDGFTVTNGYADAGGGVQCRHGNPTITNCIISGNVAGYGGGICCDRGNHPRLIDCLISGNTGGYGGGMYNSYSSPTLVDCVISGNTANSNGGGMCNSFGYSVLTNCVISDNAANKWGGGIYDFASEFTLAGCLITNNWASVGGSIYCRAPSEEEKRTVTDCTIADNVAGWYGGIYCDDSNIDIVNSIIWGNSRRQVYIRGMSHASVVYSDIQGGRADVYVGPGCTLNWGPGNINADPCFTDPNSGDYHLLEDSPCINTGDPNYVPQPDETDLDGLPRVIGPYVDMGAYEFNHIPIADAGPDQNVIANNSGVAQVTLDGSGSCDEDDDELTYLWTWSIDNRIYKASGVNPVIELPVGRYTIRLVVSDGIDESEPDQVVITVTWPPLETCFRLMPRVINRDSQQRTVLACISFPKGITKNMIDMSQPLLLNPGGIEALRKFVYTRYLHGGVPYTNILAFFDKNKLMNAVPGNGLTKLRITGQLKTGQPFFGVDTIIIKGKEKDKDPKPPVPKK